METTAQTDVLVANCLARTRASRGEGDQLGATTLPDSFIASCCLEIQAVDDNCDSCERDCWCGVLRILGYHNRGA